MGIVALLIVYVLSFVIYVLTVKDTSDVKHAELFSNRDARMIEQACKQYADVKVIPFAYVQEIIRHVERTMNLPMGYVLPSDRFDVELKLKIGSGFDSPKNALMHDLYALHKKKNRKLNAREIKTVDDYIMAMRRVYGDE